MSDRAARRAKEIERMVDGGDFLKEVGYGPSDSRRLNMLQNYHKNVGNTISCAFSLAMLPSSHTTMHPLTLAMHVQGPRCAGTWWPP